MESVGYGLAPVKPQGNPTSYDTDSQGATTRFTHVAYSLGYIVTFEELRDNQYAAVSKRRAMDLAFSMRQTHEKVAANVYNRAFTSTFTGGDGKELCATDHPTFNGTQSNELTTAADLSEAAIEDMCIQIMQAKNSRGHVISLSAQSLHIPPAYWFEANRILKSVLQNDTANNAVNVLKATNALPKGIKVNQHFTSDSAWFMRTNARRGMYHFQRDAVMFDKDSDFDTKNAKAMAYERYSVGWGDWRAVYGTPGL